MKDHEDQLRVNIDSHLKGQMKKDDRTMKEVITTLVEREYATEEAEIRTKIEELEDQVEFRQRKIDRQQQQQQEDREEIRALKAQLDAIEEQKQDYNEWLNSVLDWWEEQRGGALIPIVIKARDGFHDYEKSAEQVQQDLKDLAIEQEREITAGDFTKSGPGYREEPLYKQVEDGDEDSEGTDQDEDSPTVRYGGGTTEEDSEDRENSTPDEGSTALNYDQGTADD